MRIAIAVLLAILVSRCASQASGPTTPTPTPLIAGEAVWAYRFVTMGEGLALADASIIGEIVDVDRSGIFVTPRLGQELHYTINTIAVVEQLAGEPLEADHILLKQPGGGRTPYYSDHPPFAVGESVLLFVRAIEDGLYISLNPNGRFTIVDDVLRSVARPKAYPFQETLAGTSLSELRALVASSR